MFQHILVSSHQTAEGATLCKQLRLLYELLHFSEQDVKQNVATQNRLQSNDNHVIPCSIFFKAHTSSSTF